MSHRYLSLACYGWSLHSSFAALLLFAIADQLADAGDVEGRVGGHGGGGRSAGIEVLVPPTPLRCRAGDATSGYRVSAVFGDISCSIGTSDPMFSRAPQLGVPCLVPAASAGG